MIMIPLWVFWLDQVSIMLLVVIVVSAIRMRRTRKRGKR